MPDLVPDRTNRTVSIFDFVTGAHRTSLAPGECCAACISPRGR